MLAPAFIRSSDQQYGTRCSTLVITERASRHNVTHVFERSSPAGGMALLRRATLNRWPPRYKAPAMRSAGDGRRRGLGIQIDGVAARRGGQAHARAQPAAPRAEAASRHGRRRLRHGGSARSPQSARVISTCGMPASSNSARAA